MSEKLRYADCIPCRRGKISIPDEGPGYDIKLNLVVRIQFWSSWELWSSLSLSLLPGPLRRSGGNS